MSEVKHTTPTLASVYSDDPNAWKSTELLHILNAEPNPAWVEVNEGVPYLSISRIEMLLDQIFLGR